MKSVLLDVIDRADPLAERGDLLVRRVIVNEDLELDLVPDLVRLRGGRPDDGDEHAQYQRRDQDRGERGQARRGIAPERPQGLLQEESDSHRLLPRDPTGSACARTKRPDAGPVR